MRLSVVGTGYLGTTHAVAMAELGHTVVGVDTDPARIASLQAGRLRFYEPGLADPLARHVAAGTLRFTTSIRDAAESADVHFVCVGTPQRAGELAADLSFVDAAMAALVPYLAPGSVVVGKSTVPAGTAARLAPAVAAAGAELVWNPEFLREGFALRDSLDPDRIVLGIEGPSGLEIVSAVYAPILAKGTPLVVTDFATAELVKVAANSFLATKISFINAMADVCDAVGADVTRLAEALGHDPRIGDRFLHAGLGYGGGCLPKDVRAFIAQAHELGADHAAELLSTVERINLGRRMRLLETVRATFGGSVAGRRVGVLGAAFKPDSDDIRDSPALVVAQALHDEGAHVQVYDPKAMPNARIDYPSLAYCPSALEACGGADIVLHLTEWREFREITPDQFGAVVAQRAIVDGRNALDAAPWRAAGWTFRALGRH